MRWIRRVLYAVFAVVALAVVAFFLIPAERIAGIAADRIGREIGREITVAGPVRPTLYPVLGVSTGRVTVANADWAGPAPMIEAEGLDIGIDASAALSREIRVTRIRLDTPVIRLVTDADGRGNWEVARATATPGEARPEGGDAASPSTSARAPVIETAEILGGRITFAGASGTIFELSGIEAGLSIPESGPASLALEAVSLGTPVSLDADIAEPGRFLSGGTGPVTLALGAGGNALRFDGLASPAAAEGRLEADLSDLAGLLATFGQDAPDLPEGLGRDRIALEAGLAADPARIELSGLALVLDANRATGDLALALGGPRPRLTGALNLGAFVLPEAGAEGGDGGGGGEGGGDAPAGWSTEPFDLAGLGTLDAALDLRAASLSLGESEIGETDLGVTLDDRRLVTDIRRLRAYDGAITGQMILNGRGTPSARLDVAGSALAISRLLSELAGYDRIIAAGDLELDVLGQGPHMDAMMKSLNGEGRFEVGAGELLGLDIVGLLRTLDPSVLRAGRSTIFDRIVGTFRIENGVVINEDLTIAAPLFRAEGKGRVGVGGRTLDYTLTPRLLGEEKPLRIPIRITGTWDSPKFGVDLEVLARDRLEDGLRERAAERLGVAPEEVEDKARETLEREIRRGLGGLLGR